MQQTLKPGCTLATNDAVRPFFGHELDAAIAIVEQLAAMTTPTDGLSPEEIETFEDDRDGEALMSDSEALQEFIRKARAIVGTD